MAISEAQRKAVAKYNAANYDRIELRVEKGQKQVLQAHAESKGETLNSFVKSILNRFSIVLFVLSAIRPPLRVVFLYPSSRGV